MSQINTTGCKGFAAGAARAAHLRVYLSSGALATAGATQAMIGTQDQASFAATDRVNVRLKSAQGTMKCVASEGITGGALVYAAASGKVASSGTVVEGVAMETVTADGDIIEVMPTDA